MYNLKVKYPKMEKIIFTAQTRCECMEKLKSILGYGSCIPSDCSFIIESNEQNEDVFCLF